MKLLSTLFIVLPMTLLSACGGGGGGSGTNSGASTNTPVAVAVTSSAGASSSSASSVDAVTTTNFIPDAARLESAATQSTELYVQEKFSFDGFTNHQLAISAKDSDGQPITQTVVKIYAIPADMMSMADERLASADLLLVGTTDDYGDFYRKVEWPNQVSRILVTLDAIGLENEILLNLNTEQVTYIFQ